MRGVISLIIAILALCSAQAQRPFIEYLGEVPGMVTYDLFTNSDSTLSFVGWDNFSGSTVISKVDTNGNLIWQQANPNGCGARYMSGIPSKKGGFYALELREDCWRELYINFLNDNGVIEKSVKLWNKKLDVSSQFYLNYFKETDSSLYVLVNSGNGNTTIEKIDLQDSTHVGYKLLPELEDRSFSSKHYKETEKGWLFTLNDGVYLVDTNGVVRQYQFLNNIEQYYIEGMMPQPNNNSNIILAYGYEKLDDPNSSSKQKRPRVIVLDTSDLSFEVINLVNVTDQDNRYNYRIMDCVSFGDMSLITMNYVINGSGDQYNVYTLFDSQNMEVFYEESVLNETGYDISPIHLTRVGQSAYSSDGPSRVQKITPKNASLSIEKIASESELDIYPNPTNDEFSIHLRNRELIEKVQVYSLNGNLVKGLNPGSNKTVITLEQAGVYLVKIITDNGVYNRKVIKL